MQNHRLIKFVLLFLLPVGCSVLPEQLTAEQCRGHGVAAEGEITGKVVSSEFGTFGKIRKECGSHAQGCTKGVNDTFPDASHQYKIYYAEHKCAPQHEACHAMYEVRTHTRAFTLQYMQGNNQAACS